MSLGTQTFRGTVEAVTSGTRFFKKNLTVTTPGVEQTLISEVVAANTEIYLLQCNVSCRLEGVLKVLVNSVVIASVRTGPANPNADFNFNPYHTAIALETVDVKFTSMVGRPVTDIEVYLQGREVPA